MTTPVRASLRRACEEIEDVCENTPVSDSVEEQLRGLATQLCYLAEGDASDPEALARPDPRSLDTIRERLKDIIANADSETAIRLERACDEVLEATSVLTDRIEKERDAAAVE